MQEADRTEHDMSGSGDAGNLERLRFVSEHRVCWEVLPEEFPVKDDRLLQIGFSLELYGAHGHAAEPPRPGCEQCRTILAQLREIADWIRSKTERASRYEISVRDNVILYDPVRRHRSEVMVAITISPSNAIRCPRRCLRSLLSPRDAKQAQGDWGTAETLGRRVGTGDAEGVCAPMSQPRGDGR